MIYRNYLSYSPAMKVRHIDVYHTDPYPLYNISSTSVNIENICGVFVKVYVINYDGYAEFQVRLKINCGPDPLSYPAIYYKDEMKSL